MPSFFKKSYIIFLSIFSVYILFLALVTRIFFIYHLSAQNLLFLGLIGIDFSLPYWAIYFFSVGSFLIFCLICLKIFPQKSSYYPMLIYAITPWFQYLTVARSVYIYLLFLILVSFLGLILMKQKSINLGRSLFLIGSLFSVYSFITPIFVYFLMLIGLKFLNLYDQRVIKKIIIIFLLGIIPLGFLIKTHHDAFENMYKSEITIFSNPGLLADGNRLQGDSKALGFSNLAKLSENKYFYFSKYMLLKLLYHLTPATYFTPEEKLLNFSFTPPLLLGLLVPFFYGFYKAFDKKKFWKISLILPIFTIPSFLSQKIINLNHLVIIAPAIILISSFGLMNLIMQRRKIVFSFLVVLLVTQLFFITLDIIQREDIRYHKYFGANVLDDLGRQ